MTNTRTRVPYVNIYCTNTRGSPIVTFRLKNELCLNRNDLFFSMSICFWAGYNNNILFADTDFSRFSFHGNQTMVITDYLLFSLPILYFYNNYITIKYHNSLNLPFINPTKSVR